MKKLSLVLVALFSITIVFAQGKDVPFEKEFFKEQKSEFKEARRNYEDGDAFLNVEPGYMPDFNKALKYYMKAYDFNPKSAMLNFKIGLCNINSPNKYQALQYFLDAYELNPTVDKQIHYYIGLSKQLQYAFDDALYEYELYRKILSQKDDLALIDDVGKRIKECKSGNQLLDEPVRVWIDNLGAAVNSSAADYSPMITADESVIMITTRREEGTGDEKDPADLQFMEDIFYSEKDEKGAYKPAKNIGDRINSDKHDATSGLSHDGQTLFIYYGRHGRGDIYVSNKEKEGWTKSKSIGKKINKKDSWETAACMSYDKKQLFFVSDREGGLGKRDIWISDWDAEKEEWMDPTNLGDVINSKYDEAGVYAHPDGRTIYFSSKGHTSMGGFDIFKSVKDDNGVWQTPENIGFPVNTPDDDVHFVISASGKHGYYSSFKEDGLGEKDIYMITFLGEEKAPLLNAEDNLLASVAAPVTEVTKMPKVKISESSLAILKGVIRDEKTKQPLLADIELIDNATGNLIQTFKSDATTGKYLVSLPSGKNYGIAVKAAGYLFHSVNVDIPRASGYKEYVKDVDLKKVEVGKAIVLRNIFFDLSKASLRPESKAELERLYKIMIENPTLKIELSGHTDTRGSDSYNLDLSDRRAKSVVKYIAEKGIDASRMVAKGYGEEQTQISDAEIGKLVTKDDKEEAHQQNRRTEMKILSL